MKLTLESGRVIHDATEADILASIEGEHFAILGGDNSYIQYWVDESGKGPYTLEYQEGSLDKSTTGQWMSQLLWIGWFRPLVSMCEATSPGARTSGGRESSSTETPARPSKTSAMPWAT